MVPINFIADYYGERYGFYFAWLAYYTATLVPIAIVGVFFFIFQLVNFFMYRRGESYEKALDWEFNFIYSVIVSIWATLVVEGWKRMQAKIGNSWLIRDFKHCHTTELPSFQHFFGVDEHLKQPTKYSRINSHYRQLCIGLPVTLAFLVLVFAVQL